MKLKQYMRAYPIPACCAVALLVFALMAAVSFVRKLLPESLAIDYVRQLFSILWPLALTLVLGYGWCYRRGSFGKTLLAGAFALGLFSFTFLVRAGDAILSDETAWKSAAGIGLGLINLFGIGFREETIYRGVIANSLGIACGKDPRGVWKAVITSGLIFGLAHFSNIIAGVQITQALIQVISACAIGILFTAVYFRGGNLWALVLIHCLIDAGGLFRSAFTTASSNVEDVNNLSWAGLVIVPIFLGVTLFLLRKKKMPAVLENLRQAAECDRQNDA